MKKIVIVLIGLFFFSNAYAQKEIKGTSTYFPEEDSIIFSSYELDYLINNSYVVCSKIDIWDDGYMIKTVHMSSRDTTFRNIYIESDYFIQSDLLLSVEQKTKKLKCAFALIDNGKLYESYELDQHGMKHFESLLNSTPLYCLEDLEGSYQ